ncbi:hypothetical protein IEO21_07270 [Rhodonia placenta]|uniref:Uncharacterized protein n=1 Tax=Rhodonia placenta TaxID=104341 RepID=A0A8H7NYG5_9APHY|nr:hypothetical protein IEO21_07270 [Postia placenta]
MPWPLPVEVWLLIIDELGAQGEYDALEACAKAGEGLLKERANSYIPNEMTFRTPEEVASINVRQRWEGPYSVHFDGGRRSGERLPIPHLATFASRLAGKWTNVNELTIERAEWRVQHLTSLLLDLGYFNNVSRLLHLGDVEVVQNVINTQTLSALGLRHATSLGEIHVQRRTGSLAAHSESAGLLALTMPFLKTPPWRNVWHLGLQDLTLPTPGAFACLLCALPALKRLIIEGPHIPVNMPFPSRLDTLRFGDDFSLLSDLQSLHDLVDLFIQTGTTARLISLVAPLGPATPQPQRRLKLHRF